MKRQVIYRWNAATFIALLLTSALVGCAGQVPAPTLPPEASPATEATATVPEATSAPTEPGVEPTPTSPPTTDSNVLYQEDFTNPTTGWAVAEFGSYFIGYHEPESYHVEIQSAHLPAPVVSIPDAAAHTYTDATIELAVQTVSGKTSTEGDYRYGIAFRQSGANYYAFTISPTTKKWEVFKSSPSGFTPLKDGIDDSIQGLDVDDVLRVDASGFNFSFYINGNPVTQITDSDYSSGTVGLYAENLENVKTHIHFNTLSVRELEGVPQPEAGALFYQEDFTNPTTGWAKAEFGSYFIGYHEPESYHIEIQSPHLPAPVVTIPDAAAHTYTDATVELAVQTVSGKTSTEGDYRYGIAFRQSGANYYAFTISPTTKKWEVFKSSPSGFTPLKEGIEDSIQGLDVDDVLRVDAQGSHFLLYVNDKLVGQVTDADYAEGTVGLYAENLENVKTHIHFNTLSVREVKFSMMCSVLDGGTVYVRSGPSKSNPQVGILSSGDTVQAKGISSNQWIQVIVEGSNEPGWVSWSDAAIRRILSCTPSVDLFPIVNP